MPNEIIYIAIMDFTKLEYQLECIASQNSIPAEMVLEKWLEKQQHCLNGSGKLKGQEGTFPWKLLPRELAHHGYILQHYPANILMPGEKCDTLTRSKGIHDLSLCEHQVFSNALKNNSLTIKTITRQHALVHLMASNSPVIIEEAPASHSISCIGQSDGGVHEEDKVEVDELLASQESKGMHR
ncbi:hypothetical protein BDR06DRAFT_975714 [Suillus hirtellus]|nr:hypothetical protein BDR06DRAFT_975714 [Suillus hirtellus]